MAALLGAAVLLLGLFVIVQQSLSTPDYRPGTSGVPQAGWDPGEPRLTQQSLLSGGFHQVHDISVRGQIYAQPVAWRGTVVVATETNDVYGIERATGAVLWHRNLGRADTTVRDRCPDQISPSEGITSTPVVDPAAARVYLTTRVLGEDGQTIRWQMHALRLDRGGAEDNGWPLLIEGAATNAGNARFNARVQRQRPGLLLLHGRVFAAFGGICDEPPYRGWVASVRAANSAAGARLTLWTDEAGDCSDREACAGIWMGGSPPVADGDHIVLSTGNGTPPRPGAGKNPPGQLGNSVVRLRVNIDGSVEAEDFFASYAADTENTADLEIGSGGPLLLPATYGLPSHPHLAVLGSKSGRIFVLDRDALGGARDRQ